MRTGMMVLTATLVVLFLVMLNAFGLLFWLNPSINTLVGGSPDASCTSDTECSYVPSGCGCGCWYVLAKREWTPYCPFKSMIVCEGCLLKLQPPIACNKNTCTFLDTGTEEAGGNTTTGRDTSPAPEKETEKTPSVDAYVCETDADCAVKDVHNCCGYYPRCVNRAYEPDIEAVRTSCQNSGLLSVCGYPEIDECACHENRCVSLQEGRVA